MPKKKPYKSYICKDCEIDFIVSAEVKRCCCPNCGDSIHVEVIRNIWLERPFNYKRPWTDEEDSMILAGKQLGRTYEQIGKEINRTGKAVNRRSQQLRRMLNG
ncbi:hypothetical protein AQ616_18760 [Oceanobacillus sp. E9]|uniref:hypothetical protein n=1 Tax=Oceanobacillus sp. E9 TaxID=1742575 RepID=UPI00084E4648|nr:hypothetical protein [Oceanobacillus sp. E9]OEH52947.1 hypothetical protein AQ616_18760 [Oceanobacillus sp. E9]